MRGLITERHFEKAERLFPGIRRFYQSLAEKPSTFLELLWKFQGRSDRSPGEEPESAAASSPAPVR
jgi:hypothetical protein